jgi:hypothetical protein
MTPDVCVHVRGDDTLASKHCVAFFIVVSRFCEDKSKRISRKLKTFICKHENASWYESFVAIVPFAHVPVLVMVDTGYVNRETPVGG